MVPSENFSIEDAPMNEWLNLAVTFDGTTARFFVDEQLVRETTAVSSDTVIFPVGEFEYFGLGGYWGNAKQLKVWDRALNETEVQAQILLSDSKASDPLYQWLLDEGVGGVMADTGRNGDADLIDPAGHSFWSNIHSPYEVVALRTVAQQQ